MQQTQNHSKLSFWCCLVKTTLNQLQTWACRTILDKCISITANTPVLRCMRKNPKALKLVFHGIPAYTIPWTGRWHFASMCTISTFSFVHTRFYISIRTSNFSFSRIIIHSMLSGFQMKLKKLFSN